MADENIPTSDSRPDGQESDEHGSEASELVTIRINGQTLRVAPEVAAAIDVREQVFSRKISEQGNELGQLRKKVEELAVRPSVVTPAVDSDPDLEYYQSPAAAIARALEAKAEKERKWYLEQRETERKQQESAAELQKWYAGLYIAHPELRERADLVEFALQKNWNDIVGMQHTNKDRDTGKAPAQKFIAEAVYSMLGKSPAGQDEQRTTMPFGPARAGRPGAATRRASAQEEEIPKSGVEVLRELQRRRSEARRLPISPAG